LLEELGSRVTELTGPQNPKHETRNSKQTRMTKIEMGETTHSAPGDHWDLCEFGFVSDFEIRASDFVPSRAPVTG
jgi:hypothetical protein